MKTEYIIPDTASKCTWHLGADPATSPHSTWKLYVYVLSLYFLQTQEKRRNLFHVSNF